MYKAGIIGDRLSVMGFRALGLIACEAETADDAAATLRELIKKDCCVVFVTEKAASLIPAQIAKYKDDPSLAIIPIPSREGTDGVAMKELHAAVERAVGVDLLKEDK